MVYLNTDTVLNGTTRTYKFISYSAINVFFFFQMNNIAECQILLNNK